MSIIVRDEALKRKFLMLLESLWKGEDLETAQRSASLDSSEVRHALEALRRELSGKPARPTRSRLGPLSLVIFTDGASRGNPGESACAVIIYDLEGNELLRRTRALGITTNNVAEYEGVLLGLELADELGATELQLKLDSELVVKQLNKEYKIKSPKLGQLHSKATQLMNSFQKVTISRVSREENREADVLANAALDGKD